MPNQYKNKVQYIRNGVPEVLVDLTSDTVTPEALAQGYTAHDASGAPIVGTATGGSMVIRDEPDSHGGTIRHITAGSVVTGTIQITSNGTVDVASYADAEVSVTPAAGSATTPATTITANPSISVGSGGLITATTSATKSVTPTVVAGYVSSGTAGTITVSGSNTSQLSTQAGTTITPTESEQTAVSSGKYTTGAVKVGAISSTYVGSGIARKSSSDLTVSGATVTAPAGYYSSAASKSVSSMTLPTAASSTSSGTSKATIGRSTSDQYINIPTGYNSTASYYKVSAVANGTEGIPTATKGTVSNHSVSVTPSVTNTAGYISGSTKTGTAVTVTASELASGNKEITDNGTNIDVVGYSTVSVDVQSGTLYTATISGSGNQNVCFAQVNGVGDKYYANGTSFTYSDSDEIRFTCNGSQGGGTITVNGVTVAQTAYSTAYYTLASPRADISVQMSYSAAAQIDITVPELSITSNGVYDVSQYALANVDVSGGAKYTATITRISGTTVPRVQVNGTGTSYSADGATFTYSPGDYLDFYLGSSDWSSAIYVNGTLITSQYGHYSYYPANDVQIEFSTQSGEYSVTRITTPIVPTGTKSITANGTGIDVMSYATVDVAVAGMSESQLKDFISRSSTFTDIDWPAGMSAIGSYAFAYCAYFNPSSLPSSITAIRQYAFLSCARLALTSLPSGITIIEQNAFQNCTNLALTSLPSGVTTISVYAFQNCTNLALTSLPSGVTNINSYAFQNCTNLALTSLPSSLTNINQYAFQNCTNLALTSLPSGVTYIGNYAFADCISVALTSLPSSLTSIGSSAFRNCTGLTSISCNGVITTLAASSFLGDSSNQMQLVSASFPNMALASNISTAFGSSTAANACQLLEFCDIGSTVGIASNAFANCYSLTKLVIRKTSVCTLANTSAFTNTPMSGYNSLTGTVYVPSSLISSYQTATNWKTLYNNGTVTFTAIEGSDYEL